MLILITGFHKLLILINWLQNSQLPITTQTAVTEMTYNVSSATLSFYSLSRLRAFKCEY